MWKKVMVDFILVLHLFLNSILFSFMQELQKSKLYGDAAGTPLTNVLTSAHSWFLALASAVPAEHP